MLFKSHARSSTIALLVQYLEYVHVTHILSPDGSWQWFVYDKEAMQIQNIPLDFFVASFV
jgi:hypothetical protein